MNDNVEILRRYNRWRRGQALWSATADLPDPRVVGEAIDAACDEIERLRAELETERMRLAMKAPITFEVACKAWGDVPSLCDDSVRKCFFAVWALLCFEWAEAMVEHAQSRKVGAGMARNPLRDAAIDAALAAKEDGG